MELKSNRKATSNALKKPILKMEKSTGKQNQDGNVFVSYKDHYSSYLLRGTSPGVADFKKFVTLLYRSLYYSLNNLKGPSQAFIKKKRVRLPEPADTQHKKILLLDLDETLIHSVFTAEKTDVSFTQNEDEFKFNVRPYTQQFLEAMSQIYNVYVFTAGTQDYAQPIIDYLNTKKKTILGVLHRKNCMETHNGFFIKDLRIIANRELKDILIVDNLVHSFGLQISNGVPILQFTANKADKQFLGLTKFLTELATVEDVRPVLQEKLNLRKILEIQQADFVQINDGNRI